MLEFKKLVKVIKTRRKDLGWSQQKLAEESGVSRPLISELERKETIPSYENIRKIYNTLLREKASKTAEDYIEFTEIAAVHPNDKVEKAAKIMKEKDFSQIPVKNKQGEYIGIIYDTDIEDLTPGKKVKEGMRYTIPIVPHYTTREELKELFKITRAVLVEKEDEIIGILTSANLLQDYV